MKILIIHARNHQLLESDKINTLSSIYAYHFKKWLSKYPDCEIFIHRKLNLENVQKLENYDFCIDLVNRDILNMKPEVFSILRKKIRYHIIGICEKNAVFGKEDLLLFMIGQDKPKTKRLFWGADFDLLKPEKPAKITILVDHMYYGTENYTATTDKTLVIIQSLLEYKNAGHDITIKHIGCGRINEVTDNYQVDKFIRNEAVDFREIYKHYNEAHIFVVTHAESFGLSNVECASAGALIVQPKGYLKDIIIDKLHHVSIDPDHIDWDYIISQIDIDKSINSARAFSYEKMISELYDHMRSVSARLK